jgi:Villin headpiece domain
LLLLLLDFLPGCNLTGMNGDHGIDPANKELYLSDDDFQTAFEMDKDAFKASIHGAIQHLAPWC